MTQVYPDYSEADYGYGTEAHDGEEEFIPTWISSTDGLNWTEVTLPAGVCNVIGSQGDVFLGQVCDESGGTYMSTDGGKSWAAIADVPSDAPEGYMSYSMVYGGDLGFIAFRNIEPDYRLFEGEEDIEYGGPVATTTVVEASPDAARDVAPETTTVEPLEEEPIGDEPDYDAEFYDENRQLDVFYSADGKTWSLVELPAEVQGRNAWGNNALIGSNQIVLTIGSADDDIYKVRQIFLTPS